jgi:hypothetical protein
MSKRDTKKISHYSLQTQSWSLDKMPSKKTKKAKVKERQNGKKEIRDSLKDK